MYKETNGPYWHGTMIAFASSCTICRILAFPTMGWCYFWMSEWAILFLLSCIFFWTKFVWKQKWSYNNWKLTQSIFNSTTIRMLLQNSFNHIVSILSYILGKSRIQLCPLMHFRTTSCYVVALFCNNLWKRCQLLQITQWSQTIWKVAFEFLHTLVLYICVSFWLLAHTIKGCYMLSKRKFFTQNGHTLLF